MQWGNKYSEQSKVVCVESWSVSIFGSLPHRELAAEVYILIYTLGDLYAGCKDVVIVDQGEAFLRKPPFHDVSISLCASLKSKLFLLWNEKEHKAISFKNLLSTVVMECRNFSPPINGNKIERQPVINALINQWLDLSTICHYFLWILLVCFKELETPHPLWT